jgi:glutathione S-transferase
MALTLYFHPLASFCHKVLIALYENGTPFEGRIVDKLDEDSAAEFMVVWPVGKFPVLRDEARGRMIPETSIIIEYLDRHHRGPVPLLPDDPELALQARLWDRFFDLYVQVPMQKLVTDLRRPDGQKDPQGVAEAKAALATAYDVIERQLETGPWAIGEAFSIADCAAAPGLFYAGTLVPFAASHPRTAAYFERLVARPSVVRTLREARPYFHFYPAHDAIPARFLAD